MALEVEVHALAEAFLAQERLVHADHLRSLVVDGGRVEVVHSDVALRADGMRHGAVVLRELRSAEDANVLDPLDGLGGHVSTELLIPEYRQTLLQRQLEPVTAGDAVASPVVEVLVRDHSLDSLVVAVCRSRRLGEHASGIEHVEPLVLHSAHVEVVDGNDVVDVKVVLEPEPLLVPLHRVLEALHRPVQLVHVRVLAEDLQRHLPARPGGEGVLDRAEVPGNDGEQVGGLRERILPFGEVPSLAHLPLAHQVPVGQEDRAGLLIRLDPHLVLGHDVRAVEHRGDAAEALSFALRAVHAGRLIEARKLSVVLRLDLDHSL
mmetsp:Transcript_33161/g.104861  ORF Transcript_33161/g.104861 Transcript_33161/m.104861 type:complete len:320 (+) Transcript_33161:1449-2408(+)